MEPKFKKQIHLTQSESTGEDEEAETSESDDSFQLVMDEVVCQFTTNDLAPTFEDDLSIADLSSSTIRLEWGVASDEYTPLTELEYKLVTASSVDDINTLAKVETLSASQVAFDWTANKISHDLNIDITSTHAYAVLVRNSSENTTLYTPKTRLGVVSGALLFLDAANTASYPEDGSIWTDLSGNDRNGELLSGVSFTSADSGSLVFDGVDDYVLIGSQDALKPTSGLTVSQWVYADDWNAPWAGAADDQTSLSCTQGGGYSLYLREQQLGFIVRANGVYQGGTSANVSELSGWYHIAGTFDGRYAKTYLNGVEVGSTDAGANYPIEYNATNSLLIGAEASGTDLPEADRRWKGRIGMTNIYSRALSTEEIQQNFNATRIRYGR
ncbi:MAG: LamG domain-containing protein [Oligoflexus sp.]